MNGWINPQGNTGGEGGGGTPSSITWDDIRNKPSDFNPKKHTHVITEIENLEETINFLESAVEDTDTALQDITILVNNKVDKVDGKELSSNDFTDELKEKLENISENGSGTVSVQSVNGMTGAVVLTKADINLDKVDNIKQAPDSEFRQFVSDTEVELNRRVEKEVGKGLSTEDFTTELKEKLESLTPQEIEQLVTSVNGKIGDVVLNKIDIGLENVLNEKQLTQDDYNTLNTAIDEVRALTHDKVDKEEGKGLSSNDFTKEFKDKLTNLPQPSEMVTSVNGFKGEVFLNHENIGLGNVRNIEQATKAEFDLLKDVVTDNEATLLNKVDKKTGYGLSQENFTPAHKAKLEAIEGNGGGSTPPEGAYVASVNGRTGNVELTSQDVGLNHVLNEEQATKEEFDIYKVATNEALSKKVNSEVGKGLSSNDFTDELKTKLLSVPEDITDHPVKSVNGRTGEVELDKTDIGLENVLNKEQATKEEFNALSTTVSNKVDKVEGKGLSTNDFTNVDKQKLEDALTSESGVTSINGATGDFTINKEFIGLGNVLNARQATEDDFVGHVKDLQKHLDSYERDLLNQLPSALDSIENKVDKEIGKGLSTNDFTNADKEKYDGYGATIASNANIVNTHIANKDVHLTAQEKAQIEEITGIQETILSHNNLIENNATAITSHIENLDVHMTNADREQLDSIKDIDFIDLETKANRVDSKVDMVEGMGLSSNDFTNEHLEELEQLRTDTISNETTIHTLSMEMDNRPNVKFGTNELEKSIQAKQDTPLNEVALRNIVVINEGDSIDDIPLGTIVFKRMGE